ncbi:MAG: hypothetical protein GX639_14265 [Fibrobacter sp.]|nr:hypothetical protein [Fibrobacter sp.]
MGTCFVIQPFNKIYNQRYEDCFLPAIKKAGIDPYRVDLDLNVKVPIDDIEKQIRQSTLCFAEISLDNPNVWYELGYAFACNKDVVMVCSSERQDKFPFDIRHRFVITYDTDSKSSFVKLEQNITDKIQVLLQNSKTVDKLNSLAVIDSEGLKSHEIALLILILEEIDHTPYYSLRNEMSRSGYTDVATSVGVKSLARMGMVETFETNAKNSFNEDYLACRLTTKGEEWILQNQDKLQFKKDVELF